MDKMAGMRIPLTIPQSQLARAGCRVRIGLSDACVGEPGRTGRHRYRGRSYPRPGRSGDAEHEEERGWQALVRRGQG